MTNIADLRADPYGPEAWLISAIPQDLLDDAEALLSAHPQVVEVRRGLGSLAVTVTPGTDPDLLLGLARSARPGARPAGRHHTLPLSYDGPDLHRVAAAAGLSVEAFVAAHSAATYRVRLIGFLPGFAYLSTNEPHLADLPRLQTPRERVPAGAVGVASGLTCVYPQPSPGGWNLIGTVSEDLVLFEPTSATPSLLNAADTVAFAPVRPHGDPRSTP